jgi:heat shock protein HtpX
MFGTVLLFGILTGLFLGIGYFLGGIWGMGIAFALAIAINFISFWYSDKIVLKLYRAKPSDDKKLNAMVAKLAQEARIPMPRVFIVPNNTPNAFATGRSPSHSALAVTEGLKGLTDEEMEGVISHEIGHISNRDILVSTVAATLAGAIAYLAQFGYFFYAGSDERNGASMIGLILVVIFAPLAALMIRMAISRSREYRADRYGAVLTKNPDGLASALRKIDAMAKQQPMQGGSSATSHLWIVNPFRGNAFTNLFSTHPPIEQRIRRLKSMHGED